MSDRDSDKQTTPADTDRVVSRETSPLPPTPAVAAEVFQPRLELAERYHELLATQGVLRGLIGPREARRLWERHLLNCAVVGEALDEGADVCDLGSGAGLPGIVLSIARPDLRVTLVEPSLRRSTFLDEVVSLLGLDRVEVVRARAEELHGQREFSAVTARAVAPLSRLLEWSMPLVKQGGVLLAMKGTSASGEIAAAAGALERYGAGSVSVSALGAGVVVPPTTVVRVEATHPSRLRWTPSRAQGRKKRRR